MTSTPDLGAAVYLEFFKALPPSTLHPNRASVTQMLFIPETKYTPTSQGTPFCAYRRRISTEYPRRNWKQVVSGGSRSERLLADNAGVPDLMVKVAGIMNTAVTGYIDTLARGGWDLRTPIIVDVSPEDVEAVRLGKSPYKAIGRVLRVRKALGLPKDILETVPAPV